jgi:YggT family protein
MPEIVALILIRILQLFLLLMLIRWVIDLIMTFNPEWRPSGFVIVILEITYTITDPPLKFLRRFIPPLRMGRFALDLSFILTIFICYALIDFIGGLAQ